MHAPKPTQQQRILSTLQAVRSGKSDVPEQYLLRHPKGDGVSSRYFKQVLLISECNGRLSELRAEGYNIESSQKEDMYGFRYQRLVSEPAAAPVVAKEPEPQKPKFIIEYDYKTGRAVQRPVAA